ncbi:gypsy/ty3 retroelement polyprotein, partial [Tanacetum coccineum]
MAPNTYSNDGLDKVTQQFLSTQIADQVNGTIETLAVRIHAMVDASVALAWGKEQVHLASLHLFDVASMWHRQYLRENGVDVPWETYKRAILQRFGNAFDDPMVELKNVRQVTTIEDYQNAFDKLISRVQEAAIKVNKQSYKAPLLPTPKFITNHNNYTPQTSAIERRAKNLCFNYDQKYVPGHKCSGKMFALEVLVDTSDDATKEDFLLPDHATPLQEEIGELIEIHILIDSDTTHNFVDTSTAKRMECRISATIPFQVDGADGGCEMVLRVQRLATLGNIQWNFRELRMAFEYNGKIDILR